MSPRNPLKALFYLSLTVVAVLIGYKVHVNFFKEDFEALHNDQMERIDQRTPVGSEIRFAVVGNINNSVGIFERRFIPVLNHSELDFLISAGNAVSGGGEDKYRALYGTLGHLSVPYLLTFGPHEYDDFGSFRFYEHFGPHFYSVRTGNTRLIFLDSTGKTPWSWQMRWLKDLLDQDTSHARILFVGHPLLKPRTPAFFDDDDDYLQPEAVRANLMALIHEHNIDLVFSANLALYDEQEIQGTRYITTGGAGGLLLNNEESFYHYVEVTVSPDGTIQHQMKRLEIGQHPVWKRLEGFWFFIYSLFYTGFVNFLLIVSAFVAITIKLYQFIFIGKDYYPDYDLDPTPWLEKPMRVAMFTNNYLPFIGGVPISIERLRRGLEQLDDSTLIVAPRYRNQSEQESAVVRVPSLLAMGDKREFRLANIFLGQIRKRVRAFRPDVIHLHHPFWLGSLGLFMAKRLGVPAIYTYHTRLEHYAHFVPLPGTLFRNLISHALIKRFANRCDSVIVPTDSTEEYLRMIGVTTPTFVQPTGIEFERFQSVDKEKIETLREKLGLTGQKVFVSVARLSNEKNIDFMIEAIDKLRQETTVPFQFLMIGDGHQRDRLQKKINSLNLESHFRLAGAVEPQDMALWYSLGDAFLFASKSETQGMVILEAMSAGLPVVAVRSSGIDDVVHDGQNGFKTPENQARWVARAKQLLEDDELRGSLSQAARSFAADYSIEQFAKDVRTIYATSLAARHKRSHKQS
ncbi:MAG: glycosyltransferase [Marinobacter sp.]